MPLQCRRPGKEHRVSVSLPMRWVHCTLFGCVLFELFELEIFAGGLLHHAWGAVVVAVYAYAAWRISGKLIIMATMLCLGGASWTLDLLGLQWAGADIESLLLALSHLVLALVLMRWLFTAEEVSSVEIIDAVSLYIIVGLGFANLYSMILWNHPGALTHATVPPGERIPYGLVLYYSFISQLTVGYGDMAPTHRLTRTVSIVQALFGVMYIAILISWFVSLHAASRLNRRR